MARHKRSSVKRIWSVWGDWIWSKTQRRYYQQRQDSTGVIETRWGPVYDDENADGDEGADDDIHADDDENAGDDENADDYENADDLAEQLENTYLEGGGGSNDRRKGKRTAQYDPDENVGSRAEDFAALDHDLGYDDHQLRQGEVDENPEENAVHSSTGIQRGGSGQYYPHTDHNLGEEYSDGGLQPQWDRYNRGGSSSSAVEHSFDAGRSEGARTGMTHDRSDYIGGDAVLTQSFDLDPRYRLESSHRFQPGEVFKVLWPEPSGQTSTKAPTISEKREVSDRFGGRIFIGFRRFIVVANDSGHSTCVPIATYGGKGCKKRGIKPEKHGIISEKGTRARTLEGEPPLGYPPVRMKIKVESEGLARESRVNYSKIVTVEHNVRVFFIGSIYGDDYDIVVDAVNDCWEKKTFFKSKRQH